VANVLFAWELGSGLGHLMQIAPLANALARAGHRVFAAVRDVGRAPVALDPAVRLLPASFAISRSRAGHSAHTFAHVLAEVGWDDPPQLAARAQAWRNLYALTRPDLIVFDHSPTALLAACGMPARRALIGNGFTVPADVYPLPGLRVWMKSEPDRYREQEDELLVHANDLLRTWGQPPLERLGQLYSQVDLTLLATLPELDPYGSLRPPRTPYRGAVNPPGGNLPRWPDGGRKRVFVYLRGYATANAVLRRLRDLEASTVALVSGLSDQQRECLAHPMLHIESDRLDMGRVVSECDLAVLNGNFASAVALLLGGKPALHVPMFLEHILTARSVRNLGAGLDAPDWKPATVVEQLDAIFKTDDCAHGATRFAQKYHQFNPTRAGISMVRDCLELAATRAG
jgi:UDP:flavonoid glycosyltransferase YjiC (YdhE family)